jgi:N,N-dimethylformamidase
MLTGYTDSFSVESGKVLDFLISSTAPRYQASIVRLVHGDRNPDGPGFKEEEVASGVDGEYPGGMQSTYPGSYGLVEGLSAGGALALSAWIHPTTLDLDGPQCVLAVVGDGSAGFALYLDGGRLTVRRDGVEVAAVEERLRPATWYFAYAGLDPDGKSTVEVRSVSWPLLQGEGSAVGAAPGGEPASIDLCIAAELRRGDAAPGSFYNGKIVEPRLFGRVLDADERARLATSGDGIEIAREAQIGAWNLGSDPTRDDFADRSGKSPRGVLVNRPASAMTDHTWKGEQDWTAAPEQFRAVHFHDDDLADAGWETSFSWQVPDDLPSGIYAARLRAGDEQDHVPFVVRPRAGTAGAEIGVLVSSFTYLAYANERMPQKLEGFEDSGVFARIEHDPRDDEWAEHFEYGISLYDHHSDGSGCCYSSMKRPILNIRPDYRMWAYGAPRGLGADLYLTDWLLEKGYASDCFADGDLHLDGSELLERYKVIITGSHPEYWSGQMLDAMQTYLDGGGRLMYLGGNGFYWVTSVDPSAPHLIEVRRGYAGTRLWESQPGEYHHSTTGERGGLWRYRGRSPNKMVGVGFAAEGFSLTSPGYRPVETSHPIAELILDGVDEDPIGEYGLVMGAASGDEIDRADPRFGTPERTVLIASAFGYEDHYQLTAEDITMTAPDISGPGNPGVRSDITFTEMPNGGAVFSAGAITWRGSLSENGYENGVSRITQNVLDAFLARDDWPQGD